MEITPNLIDAICFVESNNNPLAVGANGELGICQLTETAWYEVDHINHFSLSKDPILNKTNCWRYLELLKKRLGKHYTLELLCACYNAGYDRVRRADYKLSKCPKSTQEYVMKIFDAMCFGKNSINKGRSNGE